MGISIRQQGNFDRTERFAKKMSTNDIFSVLNAAGRAGVDALQSATPKDSGATAAAWSFTTKVDRNGYSIHWTNSNVVNGFSVAVGLQYGHGTGSGGYVQGRDYINPAIRPIFDIIAETVWREVESA